MFPPHSADMVRYIESILNQICPVRQERVPFNQLREWVISSTTLPVGPQVRQPITEATLDCSFSSAAFGVSQVHTFEAVNTEPAATACLHEPHMVVEVDTHPANTESETGPTLNPSTPTQPRPPSPTPTPTSPLTMPLRRTELTAASRACAHGAVSADAARLRSTARIIPASMQALYEKFSRRGRFFLWWRILRRRRGYRRFPPPPPPPPHRGRPRSSPS